MKKKEKERKTKKYNKANKKQTSTNISTSPNISNNTINIRILKIHIKLQKVININSSKMEFQSKWTLRRRNRRHRLCANNRKSK